MMTTTACPKTDAPTLSATEKQLLERIEHQAKPKSPRPWVKALSSTTMGFNGW